MALSFLNEGKRVALATVISTWGSAPRGVGSQIVISSDGNFEGSVSGGCVEGAVIIEALDAIEDGRCRVLEYGVADEDAFAVGLACGGDIKILIEPINDELGISQDHLEHAVDAFKDRRLFGYSIDLDNFTLSDFDRSSELIGVKDNKFTMRYQPSLRMIIIGAVHITKTLSTLAKMAGYDVYLLDPRESFATHLRFPNDVFLEGWSDEGLKQFGVDQYTAVVTLTHDPKIDTPALGVALGSNAFYIGSLGSRKTHGKRVAELEALGFSAKDISRIHAPIGLDIGSKTPPEIAISIMAEITKVWNITNVRVEK